MEAMDAVVVFFHWYVMGVGCSSLLIEEVFTCVSGVEPMLIFTWFFWFYGQRSIWVYDGWRGPLIILQVAGAFEAETIWSVVLLVIVIYEIVLKEEGLLLGKLVLEWIKASSFFFDHIFLEGTYGYLSFWLLLCVFVFHHHALCSLSWLLFLLIFLNFSLSNIEIIFRHEILKFVDFLNSKKQRVIHQPILLQELNITFQGHQD